MGKKGRKEYIQVLRLMEIPPTRIDWHRLAMTTVLRYATHAGHGKTQTQQHGTGSKEPNISNRLAPFYSVTLATYSAPFTRFSEANSR